jgi:hypothetical protein
MMRKIDPQAKASTTSLRPVLMGAAGVLATFAAVGVLYGARPAHAQIAVRNQGYVPFSDAPINYRSEDLNDPVAKLQRKLDEGKEQLVYEPDHGYLKSVLSLLNVPADTQALVFSKTSFQFTHISPDHPRALYYNDDVYVGAVHDGKTIELVSFDPMQGAIFYLLDEKKADKPTFQRAELDCTQCHIAPATRGIPGVLLRSLYTTPDGNGANNAPAFITDQKSPWKERWGGWYVSGPLPGDTMANAVLANPPPISVAAQQAAGGLDLKPLGQPFDPSAYLVPTSDGVAQLVLAHQTQMHNLITLTNYQTRLALYGLDPKNVAPGAPAPAYEALPEATQRQISKPAEQLLRYLLFAGEAPLGGLDSQKVIAFSDFAREFAARGVRDSKKRSLRDFDLHNRIFSYPCSYLIYSSAFDAIPEPAKGYIYHRLLQVLTGQDQSPDFANLTAEDRQAILSILLETKPGLPDEWQTYAHTNHLRLAALPSGAGRTQ